MTASTRPARPTRPALSPLLPLLLVAACSSDVSPRNQRDDNDDEDTGTTDTGAVDGSGDTGTTDSGTVDTTPEVGPTPDAGTACTAETVATDCVGGYGCDGETCYTSCRDDLDCQDGYLCLLAEGERFGQCASQGPAPVTTDYTLVAIVSTSTANTSLLSRHPGPDIDAIEIRRRGATLFFATTVEAQRRGAFTGTINETLDVSAITGPTDSMPYDAPGECAVDQPSAEEAFQTYWSMGDDKAFAVVSFDPGFEFKTGDEIVVWELGPQWCSNEPSGAADSYDVLVGLRSVDFGTLRSASNVRSAFCPVGSSGGSGDVTTIVFDPGACPE